MRPSRLLAIILLLLSQRAITAEPEETTPVLREKVLKASTSAEKAKAYKQFFLKVGRAGLSGLTKDEDTGIALQAAWETHKKVIERPKPIVVRADKIYDPDELKKFVAFLKDRTKAPIPDWWEEAIVDVDYFPGAHHAFIGSGKKPGPKLRESKAGYSVPDGAELEELGEKLKYSVGGRSVEFPKATFEGDFVSGVLGSVGEKRSVVAGYFGFGGCAFRLYGFDGTAGKPNWKADVFASGRTFGGVGYHKVELRQKGDIVFIFGAESHGMYMEAFDTVTGKCLFRFCTCYWFTFSETWGLK